MTEIKFRFDIDASYLAYFQTSEDWTPEVREKFLQEYQADIECKLDEVCGDALQRIINDADVEDLEAQVESEADDNAS